MYTSPAEAAFLQRADVVFIHSEALWLKKAGLTRRARRAPNGVDYARFATPAEEPAELAAIPRPRIGYAGWLKDQIDWPLLEALVERHPEWSWVLVGPAKGTVETTAALARLATRPHVHLLGPKPAADLGRWIQHLDVGIRADDHLGMVTRSHAATDALAQRAGRVEPIMDFGGRVARAARGPSPRADAVVQRAPGGGDADSRPPAA